MNDQTQMASTMPTGAASELSAGFCPPAMGVIVHDNVPHPEMTFDEEERPQ